MLEQITLFLLGQLLHIIQGHKTEFIKITPIIFLSQLKNSDR